MFPRRKQGFTLIELLVVIAVIGILAAMIFPVFSRAREKARQASCLSNMKQISLAAVMYAGDWDGYFPPVVGAPYYLVSYKGVSYPGGAWQCFLDTFWAAQIYQYSKAVRLTDCPSATSGVSGYGPFGSLSISYNNVIGGYWPEYFKNVCILNTPACQNHNWDNHTMDFTNWPTQKVVFADAGETLPVLFFGACYVFAERNPATKHPTSASVDWRHNGGANFGFLDGHVKWESKSQHLRKAKTGEPTFCGRYTGLPEREVWGD